ncbi:MAG TPA: TlpA disulfide reductase family protein [Pyrinomonadaceae bacterium]
MLRANIFAALLMLACLPASARAQDVKKAPDFALRDLRGRSVRLRDFRGRVVLLNFWATWCPPCRAEAPELVHWQRKHGGAGLQVVGVTQPPASRAAVRRFVRRAKVNYPVLFGTRGTRTLFDAGETLPVTAVIDREGNLSALIEGIILPEEFEQKVRPLLYPRARFKRGTGRAL